MTTLHTEVIPTRQQLLDFLNGNGSIDGVFYGQRHPAHGGSFWWRKYLYLLSTPQPDAAAIRKAAWEQAIAALENERLVDSTGAADDIAYGLAIDHGIAAIRALSTTLVEPAIPTPSDATLAATQDAPLAINVPEDVKRDMECVLADAMATYGGSRQTPDYAVNVAYWFAYGVSGYAASPTQSKDA